VVELKGGDTASAAAMFGVFGSVWAAMQFLCAPLIGAVSDRFGRRAVILVSTLGLGLDYIVMALAPTLGWLFVSRVISGVTAASFATAFAYVADVTPPERRAGQYGLLGAAFGIGFILGPAVGGLLGDVQLRLPFWVAAGLSLLGTAYGYFLLPESLPRERRAPFEWAKANPVGSLGFLRANTVLFALAAAAFLYRIAHDALPSLFVLYGDYRYGWSAHTVGFVLTAVGAASMIVQGVLVGPAVARLGERRAMLTGFGFGAAAFAVYALAPTGMLFLAGIPLSALFGFSYPAMQGLLTRLVSPTEQGRLQGALASVMGIAGVVAPTLFTQVFSAAIAPDRAVHLPGAAFLLAAALLVMAAGVAGRATRIAVIA
jgi:DHA1 family tetracycline resistance protein-like MFS transporter